MNKNKFFRGTHNDPCPRNRQVSTLFFSDQDSNNNRERNTAVVVSLKQYKTFFSLRSEITLMSARVSFPEMKETLSPKNTVSFDEASTIRGSASVYSIVGHDDPTAVMGNTTDKSSHRLDSTIASFLSRDDSDEFREPFEDLKDRTAQLREQLEELDQAANGWNESHRSDSGHGRDGPPADIETFYVLEAGCGESVTARPQRTKTGLPEIIEEEQEASEGGDEGDEDIESESRDQLMPIAWRLGLQQAPSTEGSRASGYISSDNSLTSTERHSSIRSIISMECESHEEKHEDSIALKPGVTDGSSNHTIEVVRGVQEMLGVLDPSTAVPLSPVIPKDYATTMSSVGRESTHVFREEAVLHALRTSKVEAKNKYQLQAYVPITDERGASLDEESMGGSTESSVSEKTKTFREKILCIMLPCGCLAIIAALIIVLLFAFGDLGKNLALFSKGSGNKPATSPTISPAADRTSLPVSTKMPSAAPIAAPVLPTDAPLEMTTTPTASPMTPPISVPMASPTSTDSPTLAPMVGTPTTPTDGEPTQTGVPSNSEEVFVDAYTHLRQISGDLLDDPGSPQHKAFEWLANEDPADLDLDSIEEQTLEQRYVAALLYFSTEGDSWFDSLGFLGGGDVCTWRDDLAAKGISCNAQGVIDYITISKSFLVRFLFRAWLLFSLHLCLCNIDQNGLQRSLPFELQVLTETKGLEFRENRMSGYVPEEIGNLVSLEVLDLRQNQLVGSFPSSIFALPRLKKLFMLRNAELEGTIPDSIEKATSLEMMSFQSCKLSGSIPSGIGMLSNLYFLTLQGNRMTGTIPAGLTQLPKLEVLELASNQFTGSVPDFAGQSLLYFVSLFENRFSGRIPDSLGQLPGLLFFDVRDNELSGPIPSTFSSIPELVTFYAAGNKLTGTLPNFAGNMGMLQSIDVASNRLSGSIGSLLTANGPKGEWHTINVASNFLTGSIPTLIGQYTRLASLIVADNQVSGSIPTEISNLKWLDTLDFGINMISGTIPEEIGMLADLRNLDLSGNQMSGTITGILGSLQKLSVVDLSNNKFSGTLPQALVGLRGIHQLFLHQNALTGDFDPILCPLGMDVTESIGSFTADCRPRESNAEVTCSCCSSCCDDTGGCLSL